MYTLKLNDFDLGWLVAILDGEGCIDLHKGKYPRVRIKMTDRDSIGRVADIFQCSVRLTLSKPPNAPTWSAEIQGPKAVAVLRAILPYMSARRSQRIAEVLSVATLDGRKSAPGPKISRPPGLAPVDALELAA